MSQTNSQVVLDEIEIKPEFVTIVDAETNNAQNLDDYTQNTALYTRIVQAIPIATEPGVFLNVLHGTHSQDFYQGKGNTINTPVHMRVSFPSTQVIHAEEYVGQPVKVVGQLQTAIMATNTIQTFNYSLASAQRVLMLEASGTNKIIIEITLHDGSAWKHHKILPGSYTVELQKTESPIASIRITNGAVGSSIDLILNTLSLNDATI
jgi:hypothetical protein